MLRRAHLARAAGVAVALMMLSLLSVLPPYTGQIAPSPSVVSPAISDYVLIGDDSSIQLAHDAPAPPAVLGAFQRHGFQISPVYHYPIHFRSVQVNYAATVPAGSEVLIDLRSSPDGTMWSEWETGITPGASATFRYPAQYLQYRATLLSNGNDPVVRGLTLVPQPETVTTAFAEEQPLAPTWRVRGTRQGMVGGRTASGHVIKERDRFVSLPSWRSLSKKDNPEYWVRITANGRTTKVPVLDVGPWNTSDNYWDVERQKWQDLPRGTPQDHAAFFEKYNGGWADKGYVTFPTAVDIGDGAWWDDLGLKGDQAWVEITFLWLGRDPVEDNQLPKAEPNATVVTMGGAGFEAHAKKTWYEQWGACAYSGKALWTYSAETEADVENVARWKPNLAVEGTYDVAVFVPRCKGKTDPTAAARYKVYHRDGVTEVTINQAENRGKWVSLGSFPFVAGETGYVELTDLTGEIRRTVWVDAVKWLKP